VARVSVLRLSRTDGSAERKELVRLVQSMCARLRACGRAE
jgi:hypothetical protein